MNDFKNFVSKPTKVRDGQKTSAKVALEKIIDGSRVFIAAGCGAPLGLTAEFDRIRSRWKSIEIVSAYHLSSLPVFDHPGDPFKYTTLQAQPFVRDLIESGHCSVLPCKFSDFGHLFSPEGPYPVDVALVQVSTPGPDGKYSLGTNVGSTVDLVSSTPLVIAQVNPQMPYTFGAGELSSDAFDFLVDIEENIVESHSPVADEVTQKIANHAIAEIPDEATLQFGIGALPDSIMKGLDNHRDLGIHGGMISNSMAWLLETGALTNKKKSMDRGLLVAAEVIGNRELFDWIHLNPAIRLVPARYSHGAAVLSQAHRFVAINSAVEISLDGTINAESAGSRVISGPGGQPDFAIAASIGENSRSILALPSTATKGKRSRIVKTISSEATVTVPRYLADRVITEYGVAKLRGLTLEQRANALRSISHPDFKAQL